jgi:release factor glutamine methyltransferase
MLGVEGIKIETSSFVYNPAEDSFLAMKAIKSIADDFKYHASIADIGTGTGILGIYAASVINAKRLVMCDINPHAVKLAKKNYELNNLQCKNVEILKSNLFENVEDSFDFIIFNAPYLKGIYSSPGIIGKAWNGGREGIEISVKFLEEARMHSHASSRILLIASSLSNFEGLKKEINKLGYIIEDIMKEHYFFEDIIALILTRR